MIGLFAVFRDEFRRIFAHRPAFSILVGAAVIYAAFYPQPYLNEALRNVPIAVVDADGTTLSRELARRVDATPDIAVTMVLPDLVNAEREVYARSISGILAIPKNFERDLLHGRASPIALYADASYFLIYQRIAGGVVAVTGTLGTEVETTRLIGIGVDPVLAGAASNPIQLTAVPLFNPEGGYATYVLPAAFVLILQQTLLIGVGLLGTLPRAEPAPGLTDDAPPGPVATVAGKMLAYLLLQAIILPLYRASSFLWIAKTRQRDSSSYFRRSVCPLGQRARTAGCGDIQKPVNGPTRIGGGRTAIFLPCRLLLAGRGNSACGPRGLVASAKHLRD
jgi:ABC-2 type transport system permease protein